MKCSDDHKRTRTEFLPSQEVIHLHTLTDISKATLRRTFWPSLSTFEVCLPRCYIYLPRVYSLDLCHDCIFALETGAGTGKTCFPLFQMLFHKTRNVGSRSPSLWEKSACMCACGQSDTINWFGMENVNRNETPTGGPVLPNQNNHAGCLQFRNT